MVEGKWRERVSASGKDCDADTIAQPFVDESLDDGLDCLQPVDKAAILLVILGEHGAREVYCQHEVVAFVGDEAAIIEALRPGKRSDEQYGATDGQPQRRARGTAKLRGMPCGSKRDDAHSRTLAPAEQENGHEQ